MGIFDFFRKKKEPTEKKEELRFEGLETWLAVKRKQEKGREKNAITQTDNLITQLISQLKEELDIIRKIDVKDKKAEERIKIIVTENLSKYSCDLEKLVERIGRINKENFGKIIEELNKIFFEFNRNSRLNFEKATLLIGKELGDVKDSIDAFFKELNEIAGENENVIQNLITLKIIEGKLAEIKKTEKQKAYFVKEAEDIEKKVLDLRGKESLMKEEIKEKKNSEEYLNEQKKKADALADKAGVEKEITRLKDMIDFKSLKSIFHSNEKKMKIIKDYENDFNIIFERDNLLDLIDKQKKEHASELIEKIRKRKEEIREVLGERDRLKGMLAELENLRVSARNSEYEKEKTSRKIEKINENIDLMKKEALKEAGKIR